MYVRRQLPPALNSTGLIGHRDIPLDQGRIQVLCHANLTNELQRLVLGVQPPFDAPGSACLFRSRNCTRDRGPMSEFSFDRSVDGKRRTTARGRFRKSSLGDGDPLPIKMGPPAAYLSAAFPQISPKSLMLLLMDNDASKWWLDVGFAYSFSPKFDLRAESKSREFLGRYTSSASN